MTPRRSAPLAVVLAAGLLLAGCGDDDDTTATADDTVVEDTSSTTTPAATGSESETTTSTTAAEPEPEGTVIHVTVAGGEVQGGGRTSVPLGDDVTIRVTSDVADHIHLHGYDVLADVAAGETAELTFTADIPGVFEVELEDAGLPLVELEIS